MMMVVWLYLPSSKLPTVFSVSSGFPVSFLEELHFCRSCCLTSDGRIICNGLVLKMSCTIRDDYHYISGSLNAYIEGQIIVKRDHPPLGWYPSQTRLSGQRPSWPHLDHTFAGAAIMYLDFSDDSHGSLVKRVISDDSNMYTYKHKYTCMYTCKYANIYSYEYMYTNRWTYTYAYINHSQHIYNFVIYIYIIHWNYSPPRIPVTTRIMNHF